MFKEFTDKIAVNCRTEEESREFLKLLHENGYIWNGGDEMFQFKPIFNYGKELCYSNVVQCGSVSSFESGDYCVITYPEFLKLIGKSETTQ